MDEQIKPVAWQAVQKNRLSVGGIYRSESEALDCPTFDHRIDKLAPLYDQQAIDTLRAEVERWKLQSQDWQTRGWQLGGGLDEAEARAERAEAEAEALRKRVDELEDGLRVAATNLSHYGHHAASKRALSFIDAAKQVAE